MARLLVHWVINSISLLVVGALFRKIEVKDFGSAMIAVLVIGAFNVVLGPVLQLLALPATILTLGLFALCVNAFLFWAAGSMLRGFRVEGCFAALFGSVVYSVLTTALSQLVLHGT
ncbi:MAG: phage holin family protein [Planctomycetota bacterium]